MRNTARSALSFLAGLGASAMALAHEGHGAEGSHWHATDLAGLAIALALAVWIWKRLRK